MYTRNCRNTLNNLLTFPHLCCFLINLKYMLKSLSCYFSLAQVFPPLNFEVSLISVTSPPNGTSWLISVFVDIFILCKNTNLNISRRVRPKNHLFVYVCVAVISHFSVHIIILRSFSVGFAPSLHILNNLFLQINASYSTTLQRLRGYRKFIK